MIRAVEYGCLAPLAGETEAVAQMRGRNAFWNKLVEIETAHRLEAAKLLSDTGEQAEIERLKTELLGLRDAIKFKRKEARSKKVDVSELREQANQVKAALSVAIDVAKASRPSRIKERKEQLDALNNARFIAVREASHKFGLWWCNYDEVVSDYNIARMKSKTGLKFHRFGGEGKVSIRYQNGLKSDEVFGNDTRFQIRPLTPEEIATRPSMRLDPVTGEPIYLKNPKARHIISIRVGSVGRAPLWFKLPVVLHREFAGIVRDASVSRKVVGGKPRYKLLITVDDGRDVPVRTGDRVCAIDVGWRLVPEGLRVAYWVSNDGRQGSLVLDHSLLFEFQKVKDLQSIIDKRFEEIKAYIHDRIQHNELVAPTDELKEQISNIGQWRSPGRLYVWYKNAVAASFKDEIIDAWRIKQHHLFEWVSSLRDQVIKRRREHYRVFASQIANSYDRILIEEFDLREVTEKVLPESTDKNSYSSGYRYIASVSELRLTLKSAASKVGVPVQPREGAFTTQRCHVCHHINSFDAAVSVVQRCQNENCLAVWDQDFNAAMNLLATEEEEMKAVGASA